MRRTSIILLQSLIVLTLLLFHVFDPFRTNPRQVIDLASTSLIALFVWLFWSWWILTKSLFDPYSLFLLSALIFNGGHAIIRILGTDWYGLLYNCFSFQITLQTLHLIALGVASWHLGALICLSKRGIPSSQPDAGSDDNEKTLRSVRWVGWGLLAISIIPAASFLWDTAFFSLSHRYSELYQRTNPVGFEAAPTILARFLVPAALFILAGSKNRRASTVVSGIVLISYTLIYLFIGKRGEPLMALAAYAWLWHKTIRPLPLSTILGVALVVLLIVIPVTQVTRQLPGEERLQLSFLKDAFTGIDNPAVHALGETGYTMHTVAYTLMLVPAYRNYDMGLGYLYGLLSIIPNLFWDIHPATAHAYNWWLNWTVSPALAAQGGGLGFSFIAEAYLNFGWVGMPLILSFLSFLFVRMALWAENPYAPAKLAMVAVFLAFSLMYARGTFSSLPRFFVWYALIPYLAVKIQVALSKRLDSRLGHAARHRRLSDVPQYESGAIEHESR